MQRLSKKSTSQKWDPSRRVQTETCDTDDHFDIQALMKKYKKIDYLQQQQQQQQQQPQQQQQQVVPQLPQQTQQSSQYGVRKPAPGATATSTTTTMTMRKSNGHSVDKQKPKSTSTRNISNVLMRNNNYNKSLVANTQPQGQHLASSSNVNNNSNNNNNNINLQNSSQAQENIMTTAETAKKLTDSAYSHSGLTQNLGNVRLKTEPSTSSSLNTVDPSKFTYQTEKVVGSGTFGVVYRAKVKETGQTVAIKKVLQDKRYKNRELQILKELNHPNVMKMIHAYFSQGENPDEQYLHVVMPYFPETMYSLNRHYIKQRQFLPNILVKLYAYQIMRSLLYIHTQGICHRDIKPHNILVDPQSNRVVLCDFGSAKKLVQGEPNISYICSRCYRAPELIFGATNYTNQIDVWSAGCVIAEMINGEPLFIGESAVDQLVEIIKVLGTPTKEQVLQMNNQYDLKDYKFPLIKSREWKKVMRQKTEPLAVEFISKVLVYSPTERVNPIQALIHPFFDELRDEKKLKQLSTKIRIPNLFDFTQGELSLQPELTQQLIPSWYKDKFAFEF